MTAKKATATPKSQSPRDKFMEKARELGTTTEFALNKIPKRVGTANESTAWEEGISALPKARAESEAMMAKKIKLKFDRHQLEHEFRRQFTEVEITKLDLLLQDEYDKTKDRRKKKKLRRKAVLSAIAPEIKT